MAPRGVVKVVCSLFALALLVGFLSLGLIFSSKQANAAAGINEEINYQGRLFNSQGATVPDGYYNIQFKIYQDGDGQSVGNTTGSPSGSLKWTESHLNTNSQGVQVKNGFMSVQLGSVTAFGSNIDWNQDKLWISMNIGSTNGSCTPFSSCSPDGEMVPMKRLSANPYSLNSGRLGGLASSQYIQMAQGVQTDVANNSDSIFLNKTGTGGNFLHLQSGGADAFTLTNTGDATFGNNANHTISVAAASSGAGKNLSVAAGAGSSSGSGGAGGDLNLQGGNAGGSGNNNGGGIYLSGGTGTGLGSKGLVNLSATAYSSVTNSTCSSNCTITQANVDNYGTVIINASTAAITMTLPAPTNTSTSGRILYLTTAGSSQDFQLTANSGGDTVNVAMRKNTTATMIWNGSAWTPGGASNATTLQATYDNGANPSTTPEIKLDSTRGTIDIQDADTSIAQDLFNIRGSNSGGLGTVLFGVSDTGRVTIQNTADQASSLRVLNATGDYVMNINSSNNYIINNSVKAAGNAIINPGFESGGSIAGGEEGWFGPAQASIVNDSANAHGGNYQMRVSPNGNNLDVFAGSYLEVKPGDGLHFEGWLKNSAGASGSAGIQITWYDKDKANPTTSTNYGAMPGTSYTLKEIDATVPSNKYYARVSATVRNDASSGTVYFDDFYMAKTVESAHMIYRNNANTTTAFQIQAASTDPLFTADTSNNLLKIGNDTGTNVDTTMLVLDSATADPTSLSGRNGGMFYRSDSGSLKVVIGGAVYDVCTTAVTCSGYSASAGSSIQLQGSSPGTAQTGNFNITGTGILTQLQTQDRSTSSTNSSNLTVRTGNATGSTSNSGNLILDVGTATGTAGSITIGHTGILTTMGGRLDIQGSNALTLGSSQGASSPATGTIVFKTSAGTNTVTLQGPGSNPTSSYAITLPQNLGSSGDCLKDSSGGVLVFGSCTSGATTNMQDTYNNSSSPATITLADGKNLRLLAQDTTTDPSIIFDLQCVTSCGSNGKFAIQNGGSDVLRVNPNSGGIDLIGDTHIGSTTANDATQVNFQLDSYNGSSDAVTCTTTSYQGAMYYNYTMGTIRACINGNWSDISNPEQLGLLSFGVVPQSGTSDFYDLPSLVTGGVSGPCKVSRHSSNANTVVWNACTAYSGGKRVSITSGSTTLGTTGFNQWRHLCIDSSTGQPAWTGAGNTNGNLNFPTFSVTSPVLCLADVKSPASGTNSNVGQIYDTRTFTSSIKEAVPASSTSLELGMIVDASGTNGSMVPATNASQKLYGLVVAGTSNNSSTTTPNTILTTVGPGWVKSIAGTAGQFVKTSTTTNGYADTVGSIPNNSFYYSAGNTRTSFNSTCNSAGSCAGSLYVNFIVR